MKKLLTLLLDVRVLSVLGLAALAAVLFLGADALEVAAVWAGLLLALALVVWLAAWAVRKLLARRAARRLKQALDADADKAQRAAPEKERASLQAVRDRLHAAVRTIRTSKLGELSGGAALYELPWYMVIGNPAAGKSTAVVKSGLKFPFADNTGSIIQGIGGTRDCDWFFTSDGILLDTAGRYSVHEEDRSEWLGFLRLLKKNRPKAPINGILIAASVAELAQAKPEATIQLAKNLRQRVQELTEQLAVFAPVYLVFTKADLIDGFVEFFEDRDSAERDQVWGATLPYDSGTKADAVELFDRHFDELRDGLKELALARMTLQRGQKLPPGVLAFPLEFASLKPALRAFVATLFEDNPFQFRPVFRGFYFTSAVQEGAASSRAGDDVAQQFALTPRPAHAAAPVAADNGYFLRQLFSGVIFPDRNLVRQYASRTKLRARQWTFAAAVAVLALALGGWSWSYIGNRQLAVNVRADLDKAAKLQTERTDLGAQLEAMAVLQDRIEQLAALRDRHRLGLGLGLYQGDALDRKLRSEYFAGLRQVMLVPVAQAIEGYLSEVNQNAAALQPMTRPPGSGAVPVAAAASSAAAGVPSRFVEASVTNVEEAYNALKTYLMLAEAPRREPGHLTDQVTRFWRRWLDDNRGTLPREQLIQHAERLIAFMQANLQDPAFPAINSNLGLVDQTRETLRRVMRGMPARERVYADVKARAATRFAPVTVASIVDEKVRGTIVGSYAVPGTFTREAWEDYIEPAFKQAAGGELQSTDWVLRTAARSDATLDGSPDQIRKALTDLYKTEYVAEWKRFVQGIGVVEFTSFDDAVIHINRLGDPEISPIRSVVLKLYDQTAWDNPSLLNARLAKAQSGMVDWLRQAILRQAPGPVEMKVDVSGKQVAVPMGPIGREFEALSRIAVARSDGPALLNGYLAALAKVRSRFNAIKTGGDTGPAAKKLMAATLDNAGSDVAEAARFVDDQMLVGLTPGARASLRPLLLRPLVQAFAVTVPPTETELNRLWTAQVLDPFQRTLAAKYPFDPASRVEAGPQEIARVFGPEGAIAKFGNDALGSLVERRAETISERKWLDVGLRLRPEFTAGYGGWVAPLEGPAGGGAAPAAGAGGGAAVAAAGPSQTAFQILPQGAPGLTEYTVEIDGQTLRYRNGTPVWTGMVWPNPTAQPGVRISGVTLDGRTVEVLDAPGRYGLDRMFDVAQAKRLPDGVKELSWTGGGQTVTLHLRVISAPGAAAPAAAPAAPRGATAAAPPQTARGLRGVRLPALVAGADAPPLAPAEAPTGVGASGAGR